MSETNRPVIVFYVKPARQPRSDIQTSLQFSTLGEAAKATFYAMEFVEGETLEKLIKRSGRLEVKFSAGNCDAGRRRIGRRAQAEAGSSGHQTKQHHGECRGGRRCDRENHRPWPGQ